MRRVGDVAEQGVFRRDGGGEPGELARAVAELDLEDRIDASLPHGGVLATLPRRCSCDEGWRLARLPGAALRCGGERAARRAAA